MSAAAQRALAGKRKAPDVGSAKIADVEGNHNSPHEGAEGYFTMNTNSQQDAGPKTATPPAEVPMEVRRGLRVADLNEPLDPRKLSHYYRTSEYDAEVMGGPKAVAFCGFQRSRRATVHGYAEARKPGRLVCPEGHVIRQQKLRALGVGL